MLLDHFPYGFGSSKLMILALKRTNTVMENHDL